jgi:hypothetical protein
MRRFIKSAGYGLLSAGLVFIAAYFFGAYVRGSDALREALNPLSPANYLAIAPILPGALLIWLANSMASRRRLPVVLRQG